MEPGGIFSKIYGECPVPKILKNDGINGGNGAGRSCWTIIGKNPQNGQFICRNSRVSCLQCEFYCRVQAEEDHSPTVESTDDIFNSPKISIF
jgi:hypothetical protein